MKPIDRLYRILPFILLWIMAPLPLWIWLLITLIRR